MNTPDTITITISRGRWSISRCMDLDLMDGAVLDSSEQLFALYEEARHAFTLAAQHLDPLWNNSPVERVVPEPAKTSDGRSLVCPFCKQPMAHTAADSWCCYACGEIWSIIPSSHVPLHKTSDDPGTTGP